MYVLQADRKPHEFREEALAQALRGTRDLRMFFMCVCVYDVLLASQKLSGFLEQASLQKHFERHNLRICFACVYVCVCVCAATRPETVRICGAGIFTEALRGTRPELCVCVCVCAVCHQAINYADLSSGGCIFAEAPPGRMRHESCVDV